VSTTSIPDSLSRSALYPLGGIFNEASQGRNDQVPLVNLSKASSPWEGGSETRSWRLPRLSIVATLILLSVQGWTGDLVDVFLGQYFCDLREQIDKRIFPGRDHRGARAHGAQGCWAS